MSTRGKSKWSLDTQDAPRPLGGPNDEGWDD